MSWKLHGLEKNPNKYHSAIGFFLTMPCHFNQLMNVLYMNECHTLRKIKIISKQKKGHFFSMYDAFMTYSLLLLLFYYISFSLSLSLAIEMKISN